jgi:antitoxin component of MazEF toxin-antitoxin module
MIKPGVDPMATQIVRVGNTLTVEIPEEIAAQASRTAGLAVEWVANGNGGIALVKQPASSSTTPGRHMTLDDLLEGIPESAVMEEIDWGPPRGAEVW